MEKGYILVLATLVACFAATTTTIISSVVSNNNTRDLDALLAFKAAIVDPQNILPTNWSTSTSVCNWIGITCNSRHQRVAAIDLSEMNLVGTIPPQLGNLSFLVRLNLLNNSFHGNLPNELAHLRRLKYIDLAFNRFDGEFPSWLGSLSQLRYVAFFYNRFSGSLSPAVFNSTKLEAIRLAENKLEGPLPWSLFNLSSLQRLSLTSNSLSGNLPARICDHLPQLHRIHLSDNQFEGEIPSGIGDCSRLQILSLSINNLGGNIPRGIWNLTTFREIYLGANFELQGEIPRNICNITNLEVLFIENTKVTGELPLEIGYIYGLRVIGLYANRFRGPIPEELFNISTLTIIILSANDLSGTISSTFGLSLPNLQEFSVGMNELSGLILTSISNASRLRFVDVSGNSFSGTIPDSLGNLRDVEYLYFGDNEFHYESSSGELSFLVSLTNCKRLRKLKINDSPLNGFLPMSIGNLSGSLELFNAKNCRINGQIPSSIGNLRNLFLVNFNDNRLEGIIPSTINQLLKLQWMGFRNNKIHGLIPSELCPLWKLNYLDLSGNRLCGPLPHCLSNINLLRYLFLNSNSFTSSLPSSLWTLKDILELDLSVNSFTGPLPSEIGKLKALIYLNLSVNQFLGEIPSTIGDLQNIQNFSLAHNKLQGLIPETMKNMLSLQILDLSFNNLGGLIPSSLEVLSELKYFNVSYNRLSGPIPRGGPFVNFTNLSFLSNEALCGVPLMQSCQTFKHRLRMLKVLLYVLLPAGFITLALVILYVLIRKLRRKIIPPTHVMFPETAYERVSFLELRQITNGFSESNLLGSGTFSSVYKGIHPNGMIWAIKVFDFELECAFKSFDRECEVLSNIRHRNLTKVISACSSPDFKALVLEYMPNGSLEKWLYSGHHILNIMHRLDIMMDVACALEYLHYGYSTPVVHCDLKPSNILLDQDMVGHVCDFGIAKLLDDGESVVQTKTLATFGYTAPEYGLQGLVSTMCDVYSFGITLMEIFTKKRPKDEMFTEELSLRCWIQNSLSNSVIQVVDFDLLHREDEVGENKIECVSAILQLALSCTTDTPGERLNMKDVLKALQKIKIRFLKNSTLETGF